MSRSEFRNDPCPFSLEPNAVLHLAPPVELLFPRENEKLLDKRQKRA